MYIIESGNMGPLIQGSLLFILAVIGTYLAFKKNTLSLNKKTVKLVISLWLLLTICLLLALVLPAPYRHFLWIPYIFLFLLYLFHKEFIGNSHTSKGKTFSKEATSKTLNNMTFNSWINAQIEAEEYWFQRIELPGGLITPGWDNPRETKLPHFGLPEDMTGMRVLDIGPAEGFFSFEAERRGAEEVVALECYPPMVRKFNICRAALGSRAQSYLGNVYDLTPERFGTFDMVFFFGVLYHLRHPILALQNINNVCTGKILMQSSLTSIDSDKPIAEFHPFGIESGPPENRHRDPTCFWFPNPACCIAMLEHAGFKNIEHISQSMAVFRAYAPKNAKGVPPDESQAPYS